MRALELAGRLHARDQREHEPYLNYLLRVALRKRCRYAVKDTTCLESAFDAAGWTGLLESTGRWSKLLPRHPAVVQTHHGWSWRTICGIMPVIKDQITTLLRHNA